MPVNGAAAPIRTSACAGEVATQTPSPVPSNKRIQRMITSHATNLVTSFGTYVPSVHTYRANGSNR